MCRAPGLPRPSRLRHGGLARDPDPGRRRRPARDVPAPPPRADPRFLAAGSRRRGLPAAVHAAREGGFEPVMRLAGGRAAVYHEETLACSWAVPDCRPAARTKERFRELAGCSPPRSAGWASTPGWARSRASTARAPGASTPRGRTKLVGIGQRLIAGAAHRGAVIVVGEASGCATCWCRCTRPGPRWDPATAGSVEDEVGEVGLDAVEQAILADLAARYELRERSSTPRRSRWPTGWSPSTGSRRSWPTGHPHGRSGFAGQARGYGAAT